MHTPIDQVPASTVWAMTHRRRRGRWTRWAAAVMSAVMVVTLADVPAAAQEEPAWEPAEPPEVEGVEVRPVGTPDRPDPAAADAAVSGDRSVRWPEATTERVALAPGSAAAAGVARADGAPQPGRAGRVPVGRAPVRIGAAPLTPRQADLSAAGVPRVAAVPDRVDVQVASRSVARAAGVDGLLVGVARADGVTSDSSVTVEVDYSEFARAYGGAWASRLRVSMVGECGGHRGASGAEGGCGQVTPLATANDYDSGAVAAEVPLSGDGGYTTLAVSSEPAGDNGDYTATKLSPAGTWQVSRQTGGFSWSYPLRAVPGVGGPEPSLSLAYASQSVDGRTANTNNQGSWIGDGWSLWPGYIERRYTSCSEDMDEQDGQDPNNAGTETGDRCWFDDNATMSLNGSATELIPNGDGTYTPVGDDASRVELLTDTGLGNGDDNGEYWKVTTTDGTHYFFGVSCRSCG